MTDPTGDGRRAAGGAPPTARSTTLGILVPIPEPYGDALRAKRIEYGDTQAQLTPTHVTLLPPTEVRVDDFTAVDRHLAAVAAAGRPYRMRLQGTGTFRPVTQVVYVRVVGGRQETVELQARIRAGVLDRELAYPFHPHVTVAYELGPATLDAAYRELSGFSAEFPVDGFTVYRQDTPDAAWRVVRTYSFGLDRGDYSAAAAA